MPYFDADMNTSLRVRRMKSRMSLNDDYYYKESKEENEDDKDTCDAKAGTACADRIQKAADDDRRADQIDEAALTIAP